MNANLPTNEIIYPRIDESLRLYHRAEKLIPAKTQTLAKGPSQHVFGTMPIYAAKGKGAELWDVDGNKFLDYQMGIGPLSLGYCFPEVDAAIREQLASGITFSLMHPLEVDVAEMVRDCIPNAENVRFTKTGADATSAAIRLARAYTGRNKVICCGYHGWHDWYVGVTDRSRGIPEAIRDLSFTVDFNDLAQLEASLDADVACVILEPMVFQEPNEGYLAGVKQLCEANGALLIFDEMWTGFRFALGGAQEAFGIKPHLATYSKAVANGMPLAVLTGEARIMQLLEKDVFFFTTFGGEALSLAAAKATVTVMRERKVPAYLNKLGSSLKASLEDLRQRLELDYISLQGHPARTMLSFRDVEANSSLAMKSFVQQELAARGILWAGFHNLSFSHTESHLAFTLDAYAEVLRSLRDYVHKGQLKEKLRGPVLEPVFRRTSNFNMKPQARA